MIVPIDVITELVVEKSICPSTTCDLVSLFFLGNCLCMEAAVI